MKSIVFLGDGMADFPIDRLGGKTPLQAARKPHMDLIAKNGQNGLLATIPQGMPQGSAVANLSVLGYDPRETYHGRAVLEAANMGVELTPNDVALRCNLICVTSDNKIKNHSAGHISNEEAKEIIDTLQKELGSKSEQPVAFYHGVSYRHLLVLKNGWASPEVECAPPHDHVGEKTADLLPSRQSAAAESTEIRLRELMDQAIPLLTNHPVNIKRIKEGKDPANFIWPWSAGQKPQMKTYQTLYGVKGAVISAVDLIMGLGLYAGMDVIKVKGATGLWDTNYEGKAEACLSALKDHDFVYVHVEATDEAGHAKDLDLKIKCIEMLDERLIQLVLKGIQDQHIESVVAVLPDHPTPVETGMHARDPVPFAIWHPNKEPDPVDRYDEDSAQKGILGLVKGDSFIKSVLGK